MFVGFCLMSFTDSVYLERWSAKKERKKEREWEIVSKAKKEVEAEEGNGALEGTGASTSMGCCFNKLSHLMILADVFLSALAF